jgi:DNA-directed RNA polymerase specialized sigma24 family protein
VAIFVSPNDVVRCLLTYTDWWQPASTSVLRVGESIRESGHSDGLRTGLLDSLDERTELTRRMRHVSDNDRRLLFLWYVRQLAAGDIARNLGISRRQCFRRRANAVRKLVELGSPQVAA